MFTYAYICISLSLYLSIYIYIYAPWFCTCVCFCAACDESCNLETCGCPASHFPPGHQRGVRSQAESLALGPGSSVGITTHDRVKVWTSKLQELESAMNTIMLKINRRGRKNSKIGKDVVTVLGSGIERVVSVLCSTVQVWEWFLGAAGWVCKMFASSSSCACWFVDLLYVSCSCVLQGYSAREREDHWKWRVLWLH